LEKKTKQLSVATVETGLEVNAEKTVQQFMSCERKQGKYHNTRTGNNPLHCLANIRHSGTI